MSMFSPSVPKFLNQLEAQTISTGSTAIDKALSKSVELFDRTPGRKHKILLMFTDGEDFSLNIDTAVARAQESGITLFALGVGTPEGAPVPRLALRKISLLP